MCDFGIVVQSFIVLHNLQELCDLNLQSIIEQRIDLLLSLICDAMRSPPTKSSSDSCLKVVKALHLALNILS